MGQNIILITQARLGSTRLPKKILIKIEGKTLLQIHLERLKKCENVSKIVVATTENNEDELIYQNVINWGFGAFRGSENDVLDRYYNAAKFNSADWVVRVTSDCPLIDPKLVDEVIAYTKKNNVDYGSNTLIENFPDGQDIEVFKFSVLEDAWKNARLLSEREHVTPYIRKNSTFNHKDQYTSVNFSCKGDFNKIRMTVDEKSDINTIENLIKNLGYDATWEEYTKFLLDNPRKFDNQNIIRNEGYLKSLKKD
jgi:spore coat polysaccharide biosynthesis protein SpsF (cytidylyltransferase family)